MAGLPGRIHRTDDLPWTGFRGYDLEGRFRYTTDLPCGLTFRYRILPWRRVGHSYPIRRRRLEGWLHDGEERAGVVQLCQYEAEAMPNEHFVYYMDADSQHEYELAVMLCRHWEDLDDITQYGDIVEVELAWMKRSYARRSYWVEAVEFLLNRIRSTYALLVLKAFPLEYEGRLGDGDQHSSSFIKRQAAMRRHYTALLGVQPFPSRTGVEGWMWRFNPAKARYLDPPDPPAHETLPGAEPSA